MAWKKGYVVSYQPEGSNWGACEKDITKFVLARVECTKEQADSLLEEWKRKTLYEILDFDPATDSFKVKIYPDDSLVSESGAGSLTVEDMSDFLTKWGAVILEDESDVNDIRFTLNAIDVLNGQGYIYFGDEDEYVIFTELGYDPTEGLHRIKADFSLSSMKSITSTLLEKRCSIESEDQTKGETIFTTTRDIIREHLERDVRDNFDKQLCRARLYAPDYVDSIIALGGFKEEDNFNDFIVNFKNKLDE
jgi:hypothetical protein